MPFFASSIMGVGKKQSPFLHDCASLLALFGTTLTIPDY